MCKVRHGEQTHAKQAHGERTRGEQTRAELTNAKQTHGELSLAHPDEGVRAYAVRGSPQPPDSFNSTVLSGPKFMGSKRLD